MQSIRLSTITRVTLKVYAGHDNDLGDRQEEAGAQLADARTEAFFTKYLG
ncbi:MAG: hypothetical protein ABL912_01095 [Novosphingobium sp.]